LRFLCLFLTYGARGLKPLFFDLVQRTFLLANFQMATLDKPSDMIDLTFDDSDSDISRVHGQNRHPASVQSSSASCAQLGKRKKRASTSGSTLNQSSAIVIETDSEVSELYPVSGRCLTTWLKDEVPKTTSSFSANAKTKRRRPLSSDAVAASNSKRVRNDSTEDITASVKVDNRRQDTIEIEPGPSGQNDPSFHSEDAELAERLAEEERKEYRELIKNIEGREVRLTCNWSFELGSHLKYRKASYSESSSTLMEHSRMDRPLILMTSLGSNPGGRTLRPLVGKKLKDVNRLHHFRMFLYLILIVRFSSSLDRQL